MNATHRHIVIPLLRLMPGDNTMEAMKRRAFTGITRMLLVAYALALFRPVMPLLADVIAHAFWKNVHIAVIHNVHGKEHVHYELRRMADEAGKDKAGLKDRTISDEACTLPVAPQVLCRPYFAPRFTKPLANYQRAHDDVAGAIETPPPKRALALMIS